MQSGEKKVKMIRFMHWDKRGGDSIFSIYFSGKTKKCMFKLTRRKFTGET